MIDDSLDLVSAVVSIIVFLSRCCVSQVWRWIHHLWSREDCRYVSSFYCSTSSESFLIQGFKISVELLLFFFLEENCLLENENYRRGNEEKIL